LRELYASGNQLILLPPEMEALSMLVKLDVRNNQLNAVHLTPNLEPGRQKQLAQRGISHTRF
jgi:Leucine-rich repeat (LRR) protein